VTNDPSPADRHVHPTREDPLTAAVSEVVGGPVGTRVGASRSWWTPLRVLLVLAALASALGMVSKGACAADGFVGGESSLTHLCSSDVASAWDAEGLDALAWPWSGDPALRERYAVTTQPAAVGLVAWGAAGVTRLLVGGDPGPDHARVVFTAVVAVGLAVLAMLATAALAGVRRRRPWDAACFAVAPVLVLSGVVSWDLLAVAAVAGAWWAWARDRPVLAGLLLGLGVAAGVWPVLVLGALLLVLVRRREPARVLPTAVTALATWGLVNAPAFVTGRAQWERAWAGAFPASPGEGSVWTVLVAATPLGASTAVVLAWGLVALWCLGVTVLVLGGATTPRVSQVALLLVAGVTLLGPAHPPSHALWLLPLAALARPRWRDLLVWQAGEVVSFAMTGWWLAGELAPGAGDEAGTYWIAVAVRLACTAWLVAVVLHDVRRPAGDPVRRSQSNSTRSHQVVV